MDAQLEQIYVRPPHEERVVPFVAPHAQGVSTRPQDGAYDRDTAGELQLEPYTFTRTQLADRGTLCPKLRGTGGQDNEESDDPRAQARAQLLCLADLFQRQRIQ